MFSNYSICQYLPRNNMQMIKGFPNSGPSNRQFAVVNPRTERIRDVPNRRRSWWSTCCGFVKIWEKVLCNSLNRFDQKRHLLLRIQVVWAYLKHTRFMPFRQSPLSLTKPSRHSYVIALRQPWPWWHPRDLDHAAHVLWARYSGGHEEARIQAAAIAF